VEIIPVIDLLHGKVVRAQRGERERYLPIRSQLCASCEPLEITRALTELYPFNTLYIADLNAIQGMGDNVAEIMKLQQHFPHLDFWVDSGIVSPNTWPYPGASNIRCIIGSEVLNSIDQYTHLLSELAAVQPILSLDFNRNGLRGPEALLQQEYWPQKLICMTLTRVGSYEGPDFEKIAELAATDSRREIYAAGGIRDITDLKRLRVLGAAGALIASTLHDGKIDASMLAELMA
jgi:phosphoribosylformimino-5-aminoimidazole carboxamide ribotide isomerase